MLHLGLEVVLLHVEGDADPVQEEEEAEGLELLRREVEGLVVAHSEEVGDQEVHHLDVVNDHPLLNQRKSMSICLVEM